MKYIAIFTGLVGLTAAHNFCKNSCGHAVAGTARASPGVSARQSMCAALATKTVTVTPPAVTVTAPAIYNRHVDEDYHETEPNNNGNDDDADYGNDYGDGDYNNGYGEGDDYGHGNNYPSGMSGNKPAYASVCPDFAAYWRACQCFGGIKPSTKTVTAPAKTKTIAGPTCTQGLEYAIYGPKPNTERIRNLSAGDGQGHLAIDFDLQFSGVEPDVTGITHVIGTITQADGFSSPVRIYGQTGPAGSQMGLSIINHRGHIVPATAGSYTVWLDDSDNSLYSWVGERAVSGWNQTNPSVSRFWPPNAATSYKYTFEVSHKAIQVPIPFRFLWLNYGGPGALKARIIDPKGAVILGPDSPKNPQILLGCSGNGPSIPTWGPWAREV